MLAALADLLAPGLAAFGRPLPIWERLGGAKVAKGAEGGQRWLRGLAPFGGFLGCVSGQGPDPGLVGLSRLAELEGEDIVDGVRAVGQNGAEHLFGLLEGAGGSRRRKCPVRVTEYNPADLGPPDVTETTQMSTGFLPLTPLPHGITC